jgi:hypothetical protein
MESILFAGNLIAVIYLVIWGIQQDTKEDEDNK